MSSRIAVGVTEVYIRPAEAGAVRFLTYWPINELDSLIVNVKAWGSEDEYGTPHEGDVTGAFVVSADDTPHFEIVVGVQ